MIGEEKIIALSNASIGYSAKAHDDNVVKSGISVYALKGELVSVIGGNGVGKSTLLRTIAGFQPSMGGEVLIRGRQVNTYLEKELALIMSYVSTEIIRVPNLSVFDLVSLGRYPHTNWFGKLSDEDRDIVEEAIKSVGLLGYENRMVNYISDGERQKAMIARTLAQNTDVIVLDEPTAFLDLANKYEIVHILHELSSGKGKTVLFSTHDLTTAIAESDRMWVMLNDSVKQGSPEDLILGGDFASLFHSEHLFFDQQKGDFRIRKLSKRKAVVTGEGIAVDWTRKALERNGFEIVESVTGNENFAFVSIDVTYPEWIVIYREQSSKYSSLLSLCRYLNAL
jgi:iron complex transport system ATP-binding protein